jgi:hypothetical protein
MLTNCNDPRMCDMGKMTVTGDNPFAMKAAEHDPDLSDADAVRNLPTETGLINAPTVTETEAAILTGLNFGPVHTDASSGWTWREPAHGEHFRRCSWCGSVHPDDLAAETDWRASWADRKYGWPHKFYVDILNRDPEALFVVSSTSGGGEQGKANAIRDGYILLEDLSPADWEIIARDGYKWDMTGEGYRPHGVKFGTRRVHHAKFYSVHAADPSISDETKAAIASRSGLLFEFTEDGRIRWTPPGSEK